MTRRSRAWWVAVLLVALGGAVLLRLGAEGEGALSAGRGADAGDEPDAHARSASGAAALPRRGGLARLGPHGGAGAGGAPGDLLQGAAGADSHAMPSPSGAETRSIGLTPGQVVAHVDGVAITGADLMAFGAAEAGHANMSAAMFEFLRERAIDRQLANVAARAAGVELDATQEAQLAAVRKASAEGPGGEDPARIELAVRDARGPLLVDALLAKRGAPKPYATQADVDRYYEEHRAELEPLPDDPAQQETARRRIDVGIRQVLARSSRQAHKDAVQALLAELRAHATITREELPAP